MFVILSSTTLLKIVFYSTENTCLKSSQCQSRCRVMFCWIHLANKTTLDSICSLFYSVYCIYCIVLHCILFIVLYCIYCIVLHCIVLHCIALYCIVLHCIVFIVLYCIVLYCIVLYCIVLYCIVLKIYCIHCIVLYFISCQRKIANQKRGKPLHI